MKVNFFARYEEVSRLIGASAEPVPKPVENKNFDTLLEPKAETAPLPPAPNAQQLPELTVDPLASLRLELPSTTRPDLTPAVPELPIEVVPDSVVGIPPTPRIVGAQRLEASKVSYQPERMAAVRKLVEDAGQKFGVDPTLSMAVVSRESSFNPKAVSSDGHESKGLFQLLDRTGQDLQKRFGFDQPYNPFDPEQNVYLGVGYLRYLHDIFSKGSDLPNDLRTHPAANSSSLEKLALAAFNAGEGRVASAQHRARRDGKNPAQYEAIQDYLPESTREYVTKVLDSKARFGGEIATSERTS
jgi:soluble lytic murein transglycosylase-like protein